MQQPMHMRRIIFSSVACRPLPYLFTLFHKQQCFRKDLEAEYSSWFYERSFLEKFPVFKQKWRTYYDKYILAFIWNNRYACQGLKKLHVSKKVWNYNRFNLMNFSPVAHEMFHADRQIRMKQIITFRSSANSPERTIIFTDAFSQKFSEINYMCFN